MARICIDAGHGGNDPGAVYTGRKESDDNLALGKAVAAELRRHGVIVDETRTADVTVSLNERSNFENRQSYDCFISFHRNAFKPEQATGVETYTYLNPGAKAKGLAEKIQTALVGVGFTNRGVKAANFHVLRETKAPAVLVEVGFIDNTGDNQLFDVKRDEIVAAITKAILEQVGIKYLPSTPPSPKQQTGQTLYRVMAGSYAVRENAERQVERLKAAGFDATIMIFTP
ncbi:N-acetylmuramoyl-L-alanine amidase [Desulfoscipio gibsoniae]|uniref:N-acetylmuramoyl-L-alanine amidase n=1 Tax=Desulfoscipio gibsoniae DSM 7213 TaxID=767817 RepID=R4KQ60_9FIRM|nr:N-acetylmuramoyl-L-alanine amidase [Desulfoscipio gibsoniae]AGL03672.1 N-acetylmuramoyl-L-alanine amidase [Desulfoscipio gibsoniae DSM 7213]